MIELESLEMNIFGSPQDDPESVCGLEGPLAATTVITASRPTKDGWSDYDEVLD